MRVRIIWKTSLVLLASCFMSSAVWGAGWFDLGKTFTDNGKKALQDGHYLAIPFAEEGSLHATGRIRVCLMAASLPAPREVAPLRGHEHLFLFSSGPDILVAGIILRVFVLRMSCARASVNCRRVGVEIRNAAWTKFQ
jgi:hypothetical protein